MQKKKMILETAGRGQPWENERLNVFHVKSEKPCVLFDILHMIVGRFNC